MNEKDDGTDATGIGFWCTGGYLGACSNSTNYEIIKNYANQVNNKTTDYNLGWKNTGTVCTPINPNEHQGCST